MNFAWSKLIFIISLSGNLWAYTSGEQQGLVTSPLNTTVYLGEEASFLCVINVEYDSIFWYVTEEYTIYYLLPSVFGAHTSGRDLSNGEFSSTLTISAHETTNNTLIVCRGDSRNGQDVYSEAYLKIQGPVNFDGSSDIGTTQNVSSITLNWTPPYTLPGTEIEFRVVVSTPGHSNSITTTQSSHTFSYSALNINPCYSDHTVNFTVIGVNPAGEGEPAFISVLIRQNTSQCGEADLSTGKLGPPTDLTANGMENPMTLAWRPPFTLSEIAHYKIEAIDSLRASLIARVQTIEPSHSFAYADLRIDRCSDNYQFTLTVRGVNHDGEGDISNITVTLSQDHRYCSPSPISQGSTTEQMTTTAIAVPQTVALSKDMTLYIGAAGALVIVLLLTVVAISVFVACYSMNRRKRQREGAEPPSYKMESNNCSVVTQLKKNPAYEEPPHCYEVIPPKVSVQVHVYGQHVDA